MISTTSFSQNVTVKKAYLDKVIEELRTKDLFYERLALQDSLISGLQNNLTTVTQQKLQSDKYYNSCMLEVKQWRTIAEKNERLYVADRARKRRKGWTNVFLTLALGGVSYLYITK